MISRSTTTYECRPTCGGMGFFTIDYTSPPKMSGIAPCEFPKPSAGTIHVEKCLSAEKFAFSSSDDIIMSQHKPESQNAGTDPIASEFADDADMMELVGFFLAELADRIGQIDDAWQTDNRTELRQLAHQLKGAGGGYGYPVITESAAKLEKELLNEEADITALTEKVEDLLSLCRRATTGT